MKGAVIVFTCAMAVGSAGVMAQECATISNDLDRLACYDRQSGRTPEISRIKSKGEWLSHVETSKLTDQTTVVLAVNSIEKVDCGWNRGDYIQLVIRCMENTTAIYFSTGCHMTSSKYNSYGDIDYRVDNEKAGKISGDASTDNRALGLWRGGKSIPFIKKLLGREKLIVRMTPYSESSFTAEFNIAGLDESIKPLREACGW